MSRRVIAIATALVLSTAACGDKATPPPIGGSPLADSADQVMFGVRNILTDRGVRQAELLADTAFMFEEGTRIELRDVHLTFYTAASGARSAVLTSREGRYGTRQQQMEARGEVVVVSEDGRRLVTEQLKFDQGRNEIASDSAFVLTEPGRRLAGIGFRSDPEMRRMQCLRACRGEAGAVNLPAGPTASAAPARTAPLAPARDTLRSVRTGDRPGSFRLPEDE